MAPASNRLTPQPPVQQPAWPARAGLRPSDGTPAALGPRWSPGPHLRCRTVQRQSHGRSRQPPRYFSLQVILQRRSPHRALSLHRLVGQRVHLGSCVRPYPSVRLPYPPAPAPDCAQTWYCQIPISRQGSAKSLRLLISPITASLLATAANTDFLPICMPSSNHAACKPTTGGVNSPQAVAPQRRFNLPI